MEIEVDISIQCVCSSIEEATCLCKIPLRFPTRMRHCCDLDPSCPPRSAVDDLLLAWEWFVLCYMWLRVVAKRCRVRYIRTQIYVSQVQMWMTTTYASTTDRIVTVVAVVVFVLSLPVMVPWRLVGLIVWLLKRVQRKLSRSVLERLYYRGRLTLFPPGSRRSVLRRYNLF